MSLTAFSLLCLAVFVTILIIGTLVEAEKEYRAKQNKRVRDLHFENCKLRARLGHQDFETQYELDELKTALAVKELLLKQKWEGAKR